MGREWTDETAEEPALDPPMNGLSHDFLEQIARAYSYALSIGQPPSPYIRNRLSGYSIHTVRGWVRVARQRGIMPPGKPGRVV